MDYTKEQFIIAQRYLMTVHHIADHQLQLGKLDCKGTGAPFNYTGVDFKQSGGKLRYIGLRQQMRRVVASEIWFTSYQYLVDRGLLEKHPKYFQYRLTEKGMTYPLYHYTDDEIDFLLNSPIDHPERYKALGKALEYYDKEYYTTPEWREKVEQKLEAVGYKCEHCGADKYKDYSVQLNIHHLNYTNWRNEDINKDLLCVCEECHRRIHAID